MCVSLMATNLVKWWKTKFLNGYKQFTVLPSSAVAADSLDGRPSDTEELLGGGGGCGGHHLPTSDEDDDCGAPPHFEAGPPPDGGGQAPQQQPHFLSAPGGGDGRWRAVPPEQQPPRHHRCWRRKAPPPSPVAPPRAGLQFGGIECDVSVDERPACNGVAERKGRQAPASQPPPRRRQEFSFTLYDFDGHGKITKDDITGLVTTIYETIGSTIRVPHYGSKTIKVKLTVSPDKRGLDGSVVPPSTQHPDEGGDGAAGTTTTQHRVRFKRDLNVTIRERRRQVASVPGGVVGGCSAPSRGEGGGEVVIVEAEVEGVEVEEEEGEEEEGEEGGVGEGGVEEDRGRGAEELVVGEGVAYRKLDSGDCCRGGSGGGSSGGGGVEGGGRQPLPPEVSPLIPLLRRSGGGGGRRRRREQRSGSLQRQELLQIIQANMEKNNLGFQTSSRKHCGQDGHHHHNHLHHNVAPNGAPSPKTKHRHSVHRQPLIQPRSPQIDCHAQILDCGGHAHYVDLEGCDPCTVVLHQECRTMQASRGVCSHQQQHHHQPSSPSTPRSSTEACAKFPVAGRGGGRRERGSGSRGRSCPAPCLLRGGNATLHNHQHLRSRSHDLSRSFPYHFLVEGGGEVGGGPDLPADVSPQQLSTGSPRGRRHHRCSRGMRSPKGRSEGVPPSPGQKQPHHQASSPASPPLEASPLQGCSLIATQAAAEGSPLLLTPPPPPPAAAPVAQVVIGCSGGIGMSSAASHHLKHRNREEDQARAMAQVVRWLEKGHFLPSKGGKGEGLAPPPPAESPGDQRPRQCGGGSKRTQGRREYRHIHEHIHHHYHHYQETAIIV